MRPTRTLAAALAFLPVVSLAQHADGGSAARVPAAEVKQFQFLVGQWELTVKPRVSGLVGMIHGAPKLVGSWKGWVTLDGFGVEDELRITDASGNPAALARAIRIYDATAKLWRSTGADAYRSTVSGSTGTLVNGDLVMLGNGTDPEGKPYRSRATWSAITATSFTFTQERSYDDGKTWDAPTLTIQAKRVAEQAPR